MKAIHIADVHLGCEPDAGREWSKKRARDIWDSFAEVVETAGRECADFLFIAGDLFHSQPLKRELREVNGLFARIPGTRVILMAGNHDYLRENSWYLSYPWAENVYIFRREETDCMDFPELNTSVYGFSYWHRELQERRYDNVLPEKKERINLLLAHGGDGRHVPFSPENVLKNGFDGILAGHIHRGGWMIPGRALMAGSLEPTDCNDIGPHGYWMGEITKAGCDLDFFPIHKCEYCHETYEVCRETTEREIRSWAEGLLAEGPGYRYFRLHLRGCRAPEVEYDLRALEALERVVDVTEQLAPDYDYEKLERVYADTLLGAYIRAMRGRDADVITQKALEYGVCALLGGEDGRGCR